MKCLVTGSRGFIGSALSDALSNQGHEVYRLSRTGNESNPRFIKVELGVDELPHDLPTFDVVFHLAGKAHDFSGLAGHDDYRIGNVIGTRQLLERNKGARFVFFSSMAVYPKSEECLDEESETAPDSDYGKSKLDVEKELLNWNNSGQGEVVILRPAMVYGCGCKGNLPRMIKMISKGLFPPINCLSNKRSMVHVDDVVQAALLAATCPQVVGQTYNLTDGHAYSSRQIYDWIREALGKPPLPLTFPLGIMRALAKVGDWIGAIRGGRFMFDSDTLEKLVGSAWYSSEKIEHELGFLPEYSLKKTLPDIVLYLEKLKK